MKSIKLRKKTVFITLFVLLLAVSYFMLVIYINKDAPANDKSEEFTLTDAVGIQLLAEDTPVVMGGKEYFGGAILGDPSSSDQYSKITFSINSTKEVVSFYIGSIHYPNSYVDGCVCVTVSVDDCMVIEQTVFNHDLPTYHEISVKNAESITFSTDSQNIIAAIGELSFDEEPKASQSTMEDNVGFVKLLQDVKPYYTSPSHELFCAYSEEQQTITLDDEIYTDAMEVYLPSIKKWKNKFFAYFDLEKKYSHLSFKTAVAYSDDGLTNSEDDISENSTVLATLYVYADDELIF